MRPAKCHIFHSLATQASAGTYYFRFQGQLSQYVAVLSKSGAADGWYTTVVHHLHSCRRSRLKTQRRRLQSITIQFQLPTQTTMHTSTSRRQLPTKCVLHQQVDLPLWVLINLFSVVENMCCMHHHHHNIGLYIDQFVCLVNLGLRYDYDTIKI